MASNLIMFTLTASLLLINCNASNATTNDLSRRWIAIPWKIRYLLFVDTAAGRKEDIRVAKRNNARAQKNSRKYVYLDADELLPMTATFNMQNAPSIGLSVLVFNEDGGVVSTEEQLRNLSARLSEIEHLVLINMNAPESKPYNLLRWSQGIPGEMSFGPAPCTILDGWRYQDDWKSGRYPGDFGCREWTAQLFNDDRPYIDVTTYTKRGNFIGQFVGWSRFEDAPKPIIGMNGKTWLCLYECPDGEPPGVIADIKAWTRKHGYTMPVRPRHQPEYPNRNYQDDIDACLGE
jgi:hypothetical protein